MVAVWPPRWRSEQRVSGLAPDFSPLRRCQSTLNINVGSLPPPRTTPPIAKISSMVAGQMRHIGCCVTALFATGRPRVGRLRADDRAKARSLRGHQAAAKLTGIGATRRGRTLSAKSNRLHYGRARVLRSFGRYILPPRSFAK